MIKKIINEKWFYFGIIFLFVLVFSFFTPYLMDDFMLKYVFNTDIRVKNLYDIFRSLKEYYFTWGGRVFAHFFAYLFLMLPKWVFNIVNSIVYVVNVYLIYLIVKGNKKDNYKYLLLIHMIIFIFFPVFGQVFLWLDGSCNYSFTLCVQLLFIYKILNIKNNKYNYLIYILISLLSGMCNENSSLALIVFLIIYIIYDRSNLKLKVVSLISLVCGYLFLFLAPGNYVRMNYEGSNSFNLIIERFNYLLIDFWPILLVFILLCFVLFINNKDKIVSIFLISGIVDFLFMILPSSYFTIRSFTLLFIFIIIIFMMIFMHIFNYKIKNICFVIIGMLFIIIGINTTKDYIKSYSFFTNRENLIKTAIKNNKESVRLKKYLYLGNCRVPTNCQFYDIVEDSGEFPNDYMGKYYGIKIYGYK